MKKLTSVFLLGFLLLVCTASAQKETTEGNKYSKAQREYSAAFEYIKQGNFERARDLLTEAITDSSSYTDAYVALRKVYISLGEVDKAIETCKQGLSCLKNLDDSLKDVDEKVKESLKNAERKLTLALADMYARTDQPEKAAELFEEIIKEDPKDANSWDLYANYLHKQGDIDRAIEYYEKAYQYDPENKGIAFRLGDAYFETNRYKDAIELFTKAKEDFPGDIDIMKKIAESYYNLCQYDKAIEEYKAIIEIVPKHVSSRIKIGNAYKELKKYDKAREYYLEALKIEPNNLSTYYQLINLEISLKNLCAVKRYLDEAFKINPNDPILLALHGEYYYLLGIGKMKNQEWNPAIERYEKAVAIWKETIRKASDEEWKEYARKGIARAKKMINEVKKVRW